MTTTAKLIREKQSTLIAALVPDSFTGQPFRLYDEADPFELWADANPRACLRKFYVEDLATYETPLISDEQIEQVQTTFRVSIAYPKDSRYGLKNRSAAMDVINADRHDVDHAIGLRGSSGYVSGQHSCIALNSDLDELENVWLLTYDYEVIFSLNVGVDLSTASIAFTQAAAMTLSATVGQSASLAFTQASSITLSATVGVAASLAFTQASSITASGTLAAGGPTLLADFNFSAPLASWTTGRTGFSSAFADNQWEITSAAYSSGYADSGSGTADALVNSGGLTGRVAPVLHDGTGYGTLKCWEVAAATDDLRCSSLATGDFVNEDFCIRLVFAKSKVVGGSTQLAGNYNTKGVLIYWNSDSLFKVSVKDSTLVEKSLPTAFGDGAPHYLTVFYDHSTTTLHIKSDAFAEVTQSTAAAGGGDFSSSVAYGHGAAGFGVAPAGVQLYYSGLARGANAQAMYDEEFWQHAQDPTGLLTTTSRNSTISVPLSASIVGHFAGGTTLGTTQLPIGYNAAFSDTDKLGLYCNSAVTNLIPYSRLSTGATASNVTPTDNAADAADGFRAATTIAATAANGYLAKTCVTVAETAYCGSVYIEESTAGVTGRVIAYDESNGAEIASEVYTATSTPTDVQVSFTTPVGCISVSLRVEVDTSGETVIADNWQVNLGGARGAIINTSGAAAALVAAKYTAENSVNDDAGELECTFVIGEMNAFGRVLCTTDASGIDEKDLSFNTNGRYTFLIRNGAGSIEASVTPVTVYNVDTELLTRFAWDDSPSGVDGFRARCVMDGVTSDAGVSPWAGSGSGGVGGLCIGGRRNVTTSNFDGVVQRVKSYDAPNGAMP